MLEFSAEMQPQEPAIPAGMLCQAKQKDRHILGEGKKETPCPKRCSHPWFCSLEGVHGAL